MEDKSNVSKPRQYAWQTEQELEEETDFLYGENMYLGTISAEEVDELLEDDFWTKVGKKIPVISSVVEKFFEDHGEDPTNLLEPDQMKMSIEDLEPNQGLYAIHIDKKYGGDEDYNLFVQMVGTEDEGLYLTREESMEVSNLTTEEAYSSY